MKLLGIPKVSYLISGEEVALVDPGPVVCINGVLEGIKQLGLDPANISHILLTHVHLDHAGSCATLLQKMPMADVLVHERGKKHLIDPSKLVISSRQLYGETFTYFLGDVTPINEQQIKIIDDGDLIKLGKEVTLRVIYAPGHASHQVCFYHEKSKGLFCGDVVGYNPNDDSIYIPAFAPFNSNAAIETLKKLISMPIDILYLPSVGPYNRAKRLLKDALEKLEEIS